MAVVDRPRVFSLRTLAPGVLIAGLLLDGLSRFLPYDGVANRAWEAMTRGGPSGLGGIFEPSKRYTSDRAFGDLAAMSNRPWMRQYHREVFTTDAYGLRNGPSTGRPPVAVMVGSSFTAGSTLSDDETLPAQLSLLLNGDVYNAASADTLGEAHLEELLDRLQLPRGGTFIAEYLEMNEPPTLADVRPPRGGLDARLRRVLGTRYWDVRGALDNYNRWTAPSPLQIALIHGRKALENDALLPNTFAPRVLLDELSNGDQILFLPLETTEAPDRPVEPAALYARHLADTLARRHLRLLTVIVPTQYTVYAPLLAHPPAHLEGPAYLARLEEAFRRQGIETVNLTAPLQAAARDGLADHRYVFWRDDTHWNPEGVRLAAQLVAPHIARPH